MPPLWAIGAMIVLGFNEFTALLYNPLLLLLLIAVLLFAKTVYSELDIDTELEAGLLPGLLSIMQKFVPTITSVRNLCKNLPAMAERDEIQRQGSVQESLGILDCCNVACPAAKMPGRHMPKP